MTDKRTVRLNGDSQRAFAQQLVAKAPQGYVVEIREPKRSGEQNDKMWAMLTDVARAQPQGRKHTPDQWKAIFMNACGHEVGFLPGLEGEFFPHGFKSSQLSVRQMADLISFIDAWGTQNGVVWRAR